MDNGSSYLRLMAENLIKIAQGMLTEANRLDGVTTETAGIAPFTKRPVDYTYLNTKAIADFVRIIEERKGFRRDARLIFAHLVEEIGELSRAIYLHERDGGDPRGVGRELIDIVFLAAWLADVLDIDINWQIPDRMAEIKRQYGVE